MIKVSGHGEIIDMAKLINQNVTNTVCQYKLSFEETLQKTLIYYHNSLIL